MPSVRRLLLLVSAVLVVDTMFYAAISPLLPHYRDELDLSKTAAGLLSASYAAGTLLFSIPSGVVAARIGGRRTLLLGLALLASTSLAFGFANHVVLLDGARFVQGIGGACAWTGGMVWLMAVDEGGRRGQLIGSALGAAIAGVFLGPVLGGAATVASPELVFSLVAALAAALFWTCLATPGVDTRGRADVRTLTSAMRSPRVVAGLWLMGLPALFSGTIQVLVPLRLDHLGASGAAIGAIFLVAAAFEASLAPVLGRLSDRRGRLAPMRAGLPIAALAAVLLPLPERVTPVAALLVIAVMALAFFWAPSMALLSDAAEATGVDQGFAFAMTNLAWAGGQVVGGAAGGGIAQATTDAVPYALLAIACLATLVILRRRQVATVT